MLQICAKGSQWVAHLVFTLCVSQPQSHNGPSPEELSRWFISVPLWSPDTSTVQLRGPQLLSPVRGNLHLSRQLLHLTALGDRGTEEKSLPSQASQPFALGLERKWNVVAGLPGSKRCRFLV